MSLPRFSVNNTVLVNMLMLVILVAGGAFALTLVREMFPESRPDKLSVMVVYPAEQPQEIEKAVTIKIEEALRDIDAIEKIDSTVAEGMSNTVVTLFNTVDDVDAVMQELKNEIDSIEDLPEEIEQITLRKMEPMLPVISVAIYGSGDEAGLKRSAREMRDDLLLLPGISNVQITGTRDDEISVEIHPQKLREYNITFDEVADAIRTTNLDVSGGQLKGNRSKISVRTLGEESEGMKLEDIVVRSTPDGQKVYLRDVARIRDEFIETDLEARFNSYPAVNCTIFKNSSEDAIQIASMVRAYVRGKQGEPFDPYGFQNAAESPWYLRPFSYIEAGASYAINKVAGRPDPQAVYERSQKAPFQHSYRIAMHSDLSRFVEGRLDLLTRNGKMGLLLVLISLNLFLNWRVALWAAVGLPVSFLGTFIVMYFLGASINLLSMFGLIIVLGIVVDDAIVIGENIFRHVEEGQPAKVAAVEGAEEVMWPVVIAVATTIAAFAPLLFIKGQIGDFMKELPIVVVAALSVSLVEALLILPTHLSHLPGKKIRNEITAGENGQPSRSYYQRFAKARDRFVHGVLMTNYERFLRFAMHWRYVTMGIATGTLFLAVGMVAGGVVKWEFIQKMDSETLMGMMEMPVGTPADVVRERLQTLSDEAVKLPEVKNVQMIVARQYDMAGAGAIGVSDQSHLGQLIIELEASDVREQQGLRSSTAVLQQLRDVSENLAGVNSVAWEEMNGGPGGKDIELRISGNDFDEILVVSEKLKTHMQKYEGVVDLEDNFDSGLREVQLQLRETAIPTGLTVGQLGSQVRSAIYGREARRITRDREDVKIMVRYPKAFRQNLHHLDSMWIPVGLGPNREWVPLREVAQVTEARSYSTIHRSQQQRSISVLGNVDSEIASTNDILNQVRGTFVLDMQTEHPSVRIEFLGSAEEQAKSFSSLKVAMLVSLLVIFTLLAGLFRSYFQPLVVMSAIPFGFLGAVVGHWLTDNPMTIMSAIGMVALTGILVNDSLVLVDFINTRIRAGLGEFEASVQGAKLRLRAILLTTATTVAGLTPLMFETSFQAKFLIPMAVTLTFGLMFATALTLVIVPCLNMIFFDFRNLFRAGGSSSSAPETAKADPLPETSIEPTVPEPSEPEPVAMPRLSES